MTAWLDNSHCPTAISPWGLLNWLPSGYLVGLQAKLVQVMVHRSLPLAIVPPRFQEVSPYFPHTALERADGNLLLEQRLARVVEMPR